MASELPLGKNVPVPDRYSPSVLVPIARRAGRVDLGLALDEPLPFTGVDVWNAYEFSWLDARGKPVVAALTLRVDADSQEMVESKSLKLYLNSFQNRRSEGPDEVRGLIHDDLAGLVGGGLQVDLVEGGAPPPWTHGEPEGRSLDDVELACDTYTLDPTLLAGSADASQPVQETLHTQLLKSNCPVTGQPDWATLVVRYKGGRIDPAALLRYVVSYRDHCEFHELCVERIFCDLLEHCAPEALTVYARYTRRGGIDINPFRSNFEPAALNVRSWRQ